MLSLEIALQSVHNTLGFVRGFFFVFVFVVLEKFHRLLGVTFLATSAEMMRPLSPVSLYLLGMALTLRAG